MNPTAHTTKSADGTDIAWYDYGGNGGDVIFGHATGFCGRMWEPVIEHMLGDSHCYAYDIRGHGNSGRPNYGQAGWDWNRFADDLIAVIDASGVTGVLGVGHSSGGATELLVEERNPGTFHALYLFEPVIFTDEPPLGPLPDRDLAVRTRKRRSHFDSRQEAIDNFSSRGPFAKLQPEVLSAYLDYGWTESAIGVDLKCLPEDEAEVYTMASAHDGYSHLAKVTCGTAVVHGELSTSFSEDDMRMVANRMPNAIFRQDKGLGHFGPLEDGQRFAHQLLGPIRGF